VVARRTGEVLILDYRYKVESQSVSESIYRTLYSLLALKSSVYYAKLYGLEKKLIVMLEEPEAHVFPYLLELLVEYIARAVNVVNIVITTHNPFFVSRLCDKVKNAKVYYVHRDLSGATSVKELDFRKLSEEVLTIEDVLLMKPSDVLEKYVIEASEGEAVGKKSSSAS
jgi:predicted ATPase